MRRPDVIHAKQAAELAAEMRKYIKRMEMRPNDAQEQLEKVLTEELRRNGVKVVPSKNRRRHKWVIRDLKE